MSSKRLALVAAALLLLDYAATSVVSAATAMTYLDGEVSLPFPVIVGALLVLILFTLISLSGLRDSARVALTLLTLHVCGFHVVRLLVGSHINVIPDGDNDRALCGFYCCVGADGECTAALQLGTGSTERVREYSTTNFQWCLYRRPRLDWVRV